MIDRPTYAERLDADRMRVHHSVTGHTIHARYGPVEGCPLCDYNIAEDERITAKLAAEYPGYRWPGTEPIEAEDDDEDRIAAEDEAREEWSEFLEWQRSLGAG